MKSKPEPKPVGDSPDDHLRFSIAPTNPDMISLRFSASKMSATSVPWSKPSLSRSTRCEDTIALHRRPTIVMCKNHSGTVPS